MSQEERAAMLAFKRAMPEGIAEVGPAVPPIGSGFEWVCDACQVASEVAGADDPMPAGWRRVLSLLGAPTLLCDVCVDGPCLCGGYTLSQCIKTGCSLGEDSGMRCIKCGGTEAHGHWLTDAGADLICGLCSGESSLF